uniref:Tubulin polyglutamylase TTLL11 n=1 Tax=Setaria digitata TaxID=48799 RepID=A0A915PCZ8_9BILA
MDMKIAEMKNRDRITSTTENINIDQKCHGDNENVKYMEESGSGTNYLRASLPYSSFRHDDAIAVAQNFTIDTSRAKTNKRIVSICATNLGMREYPEGRNDGGACDIYWHNIIYQDMRTIIKNPQCKVNKFPGMSELSKKTSLTRAILSMRRLFPDEYKFYPSSWFIPAQLDAFMQYWNTNNNNFNNKKGDDSISLQNNKWYIVKPDDGAQGTGIYLIQRPEQIRKPEACQLIQEYIADPYLLNDNLKFDFRIYVVIKSINPLSIYVAREGMARFCTEEYATPTPSNYDNLYAHLTNYSLNKENNSYIHSLSLRDQVKGSKRLLSTVFHQMEARGVKKQQLWHDIKIIVVKTVIAMLPEIILNYEHYFYDTIGPQCFQIIGFDILITKSLTPILLEVNSAPSLTIEHDLFNPLDASTEDVKPLRVRSIVDEVIKIPLVRDTILLVLNLIDVAYPTQSLTFNNSIHASDNCFRKIMDDMGGLGVKRKCHLSEIFPCRYGQSSGHLLFLDKAVYLFMQFINLKQTTVLFISGARNFLKKCSLLDVITMEEMELKYMEIYKYFTVNEYVPYVSGLSFHGFLHLLYYIAQMKYPFSVCLPEQMHHLLAYCDSSLRSNGVRSGRLRRIQINHQNCPNVEIYLLPSRIHMKRSSRADIRLKPMESLKHQPRYGRSLPRMLDGIVPKEASIPVLLFR